MYSSSNTANASTCRALNSSTLAPPTRFRRRNSSTSPKLSPVTYDFGHVDIATVFRIHTGRPPSSSCPPSHPQFRFFSSPAFLHASHSQPAWLDKVKWKATISFFVPPDGAPTPT